MITDIELEGIIHEIETSLSESFFGTKVLNILKEHDGSIVVELTTSSEAVDDVEEELAAKATELHSEYECEFIFVVRDVDDSDDED